MRLIFATYRELCAGLRSLLMLSYPPAFTAPIGCFIHEVREELPALELFPGCRLLVDICPLLGLHSGLWVIDPDGRSIVVQVEAPEDDGPVMVWTDPNDKRAWSRRDLERVMLGKVEWVAIRC